MTVDFATLLGYAESLSAIPRPGERGYEGMVAELRAVFAEYQRDGVLVTPLACELYLARLRREVFTYWTPTIIGTGIDPIAQKG